MLNANEYLNTVFDDRYKITSEIGRGASSIVFAACDLMKKCNVAIKLLDSDADEYKINSKSFQTEIEALVEMDYHANIVEIYDASFEGKVHYIAMEYVQGCTLRRYMDTHKILPEGVIINFASQVLDALRAAHSVGVIHRDIKPQNILLTRAEDGNEIELVKLADFGIARLPENDRFMMKDRGIGTVHYISPEQASGAPVTAKSDLYSLGVLMYEMATGKAPFDADKATAIITQHQTDLPENPRVYNPNLSLGMQQIILRAMEKDPAKRFKSADEMLRALTRLQHGDNGMDIGGKVSKPQKTFKPKPKKEKEIKTASASSRAGEESPNKRSLLLGIAAAVLCVALIVGTVLLILPKEETHYVKNYVGQTVSVLEQQSYVEIINIRYEYSNKPFGEVLKQTPAASTVQEGTVDRVSLTVSCGSEHGMIGGLAAADCVSFEAAKAALLKQNPLMASVAFLELPAQEHDPRYAAGVALFFTAKDALDASLTHDRNIDLMDEDGYLLHKDQVKTIVLYVNPPAP